MSVTITNCTFVLFFRIEIILKLLFISYLNINFNMLGLLFFQKVSR